MLLVAAAAGVGCWWALAFTGAERMVFRGVLMGFANPPFFVSGNGSHEAPWTLRTMATTPKIDARKAPVVVSIGDDPDRAFQSSPPSPTDLAIVLSNLKRLGAKDAAVAAVLAWEKPDAVALKGLEIALDGFQILVQAAPLSRGITREAMPPAFRAASLPAAAIQGDLSGLPIVGRVAVPGVIFGGKGALAGFSTLDHAGVATGMTPMLARWEEEDRVVLAFPLLAVLARFDLPMDGVRVRLGEFLELGPTGPVIPIDRNGCLALPPKPLSSRADVSAESLIDGESDLFPADPGLIVLRDDQSAASLATQRFSGELASAIASIGSDAGLGPATSYPRLAVEWERGIAGGLAAVLAVAAGLPRFARRIVLGSLLALCLAGVWLGVGLAQIWLPGLPLAAAVAAGGWLALRMNWPLAQPAAPSPRPAPPQTALRRPPYRTVTIWREPAHQPEPISQAAEPPPAAPPAPAIRKTAAKKTARKTRRKPSPPPANS
ncbi:MAG: hypothetical protein RLZZ522_1875 [Verrucomicrobiota bacterium]